MARLVIEQLAKSFSVPGGKAVRAVDGPDLAVESGELLALTGPSGCGKTTLLRLIAGLEMPDAGKIILDGCEVTQSPPPEREVAMVFQHHALFPHLTVRENLGFGLMLRKNPAAETAARVQRVADTLGLAECLARLPETISGGQRQRVALGRAMVQEPKLFLLDEPLAHLDAPSRVEMRREIARWQRQSGATMIYVTHDQGEAMALGGRLAVMREGRLQQVARPQEIYQRPVNRFVAGFIGSPTMNFFNGSIARKDSQLHFLEEGPGGFALPTGAAEDGRLAAWTGKKIILGIRPQDVGPAHDGTFAVEARVEAVEPAGAETYLYMRTQHHALMARAGGDLPTASLPSVKIAMTMAHAHFFDPETGQAIEWR